MTTQLKASIIHRFVNDRRGNFMMLTGLGFGLLFLAAGLAVDYSIALMNKTRMNNALDAATLATARAISADELNTQAEVEGYFENIFKANLEISDLETSKYSLHDISYDLDKGSVSASARYNQDLKLLQVATTHSTMQVKSRSAAQFGASDIEVAMVLDITGSMDWKDAGGAHKMTSLKAAAKNAVEKLLLNSGDAVRISIVPYAESVNVGPFLKKYVYADYREPKSDAPAYDTTLFSSTGIGYDYAAFQLPFHREECWWEEEWDYDEEEWVDVEFCTSGLPGNFRVIKSGTNKGKNVDSCATDRKAAKTAGLVSHQYTDDDPVAGGMISRDSRLSKSACVNAPIVTLTTNKDDLDTAIDNLSAKGGTAGHIGLQWAWYTISHKWRNHLPTSSQPGNHKVSADLDKYIIFMTDGVFNTAYANNNKGSAWTGDNPNKSKSPAHTTALCNAIKGEGIKIFVVGFDLDESSAKNNKRLKKDWIRKAQTLLRNCATPNSGRITYFYKADESAQLQAAFESIAQSIRNLRLTQ